MFTLLGNLNELAQVFFGSKDKIDMSDLDNAFTTYQKIGTQIGTILRTVFSFNGKYVPNKDKLMTFLE